VSPAVATDTPALAENQAFRASYDAHFSYVVHSLRRLGVHERDLDDVTHDVFLVLLRRPDAYDPSRSLRAWLFGIAYRKASSYRRLARHGEELVGEDLDLPDASPSPDALLADVQARRLVIEALDAIDLDRRAVFVMHDLDELAMRDIAATLEIPVNTAYSRLRVARTEFAAAVARLRKKSGES
jgi:RNA polymerase sigma-70 factor (ECF subfamily)